MPDDEARALNALTSYSISRGLAHERLRIVAPAPLTARLTYPDGTEEDVRVFQVPTHQRASITKIGGALQEFDVDPERLLTLLVLGSLANTVKALVPGDVNTSNQVQVTGKDLERIFPYNDVHEPASDLGPLADKLDLPVPVLQRVRLVPSLDEAGYDTTIVALERAEGLSRPARDAIFESVRTVLERQETAGVALADCLERERRRPTGWVPDVPVGACAELSTYEEAWKRLEERDFLIVSGATGTGRTTLLHYLAEKHRSDRPESRTHYLGLDPGKPLIEEIAFFERTVGGDSLYLVDGEERASEVAERLCDSFLRAKQIHGSKARLVLTSTRFYSSFVETSRLDAATLAQANTVELRTLSTDDLHVAREATPDTSQLGDADLVELSKDNLGVALFVAQLGEAAHAGKAIANIANTDQFRNRVADWFLAKTGSSDRPTFERDILPVFLLGQVRLSIPATYTPAVEKLHELGLLRADRTAIGGGDHFLVANERLAYLVGQAFKDRELEAFSAFIDDDAARLPRVLAALRHGARRHQSVLEKLVERYNELIVNHLYDPHVPLRVRAQVLRCVRKASKERAEAIVRERFDDDAKQAWFWEATVTDDVDIDDLSAWLKALSACHFKLVRTSADHYLPARSSVLETVFRASGSLAAIGRGLRVLWATSPGVAKSLLTSVSEEQWFLGLLSDARDDPVTALDYARRVRPIDLGHAIEVADQSVRRLAQGFGRGEGDLAAFLSALRDVRYVSPRLAAETLADAYEAAPDRLAQVLTETSLDKSVAKLRAILDANRKVGVRLIREAWDKLEAMMRDERDVVALGNALDLLRNRVDPELAKSAAEAVDVANVRDFALEERVKFSVLGRFLESLRLSNREHWEAFRQEIGLSDFLGRIDKLPLLNWSYLIAGLLEPHDASEHGEDLRGRDMQSALRDAWAEHGNESDIAYFLSTLTAMGLSADEMANVVGARCPDDFWSSINDKLRSASLAEAAHILWAAAKGHRQRAAELASAFAGTEDPTAEEGETLLSEPRRLLLGRLEKAPVLDVSHVIHALASIDRSVALDLIEHVDWRDFRKRFASRPDLRRDTDALRAVAQASRAEARALVDTIDRRSTWRRYATSATRLHDAVGFAAALLQVDKSVGRKFVEVLLDSRAADLEATLGAEVDFSLTISWLKTLSAAGLTGDFEALLPKALTATDFDRRLQALVEGAQLLARHAHPELRHLIDEIGRSAWQVSYYQSSGRLAGVLLRCQEIDERAQTRLVPDLAKRTDLETIARDRGGAGGRVPAALLRFLLQHRGVALPPGLARLDENDPDLAADEMMLLRYLQEPPADGFGAELRDADGFPLGKVGIAVALELVHDTPVPILPMPVDALVGKRNHLRNLEFALLLRAAPERAEDLADETRTRLDAEVLAPVRWLLAGSPAPATLGQRLYYAWTILRSTVLAPNFMGWERLVMTTMQEKRFPPSRISIAFSENESYRL